MEGIKKGWELIADAFLRRGVEYIFSLPGESISPVHLAVEKSSIKIITTRHEQAAAFMAEAYGRMTRKPGIVVVTFGPGFTNTISAMVNAQLSNSPLILIAGAHGAKSAEKLGLQDMNQAPIIESIVKKSLFCRKAERIPEYIDMAFRYASYGRPGPVFLELPIDVLEAPVNSSEVCDIKTEVRSRPVDRADALKLIELIKNSKKPVVMAGSGAYYSDAGKELVEFVEKTGIPAFTAKLARGIIPDTHPLCFESSVLVRPGCAAMATTDADLVILLGNRLCMYTACGAFFNKDAKLVQVDIEPEELGRNKSLEMAIFADVKALLQECNRLVDEKHNKDLPKKFAEWVKVLKENENVSKQMARADVESANVPIHPARLAREVDDFMNREDDIVIADGGDSQSWVLTTRTCRAPLNVLDSGLYGCLGVGIPYANAAKLINPKRRVLLFIGDGSMSFNFMEVETSIRKNLPIVIVVNNNTIWGMTGNMMKVDFDHFIPDTVEIGNVAYHKAVEAFGGKGILVEKPDDIRPALEEAFRSGKTTCINVKTDPKFISPGTIALAMLKGKTVVQS